MLHLRSPAKRLQDSIPVLPFAAFVLLLLTSCGGDAQADAQQKAMVAYFSTAKDFFQMNPRLATAVEKALALQQRIGGVQFVAPVVVVAQTGKVTDEAVQLRVTVSSGINYCEYRKQGKLDLTATVTELPLEVVLRKNSFGEWSVVDLNPWKP